jgi:hypothetical protein
VGPDHGHHGWQANQNEPQQAGKKIQENKSNDIYEVKIAVTSRCYILQGKIKPQFTLLNPAYFFL